jgi:hypothetical protein
MERQAAVDGSSRRTCAHPQHYYLTASIEFEDSARVRCHTCSPSFLCSSLMHENACVVGGLREQTIEQTLLAHTRGTRSSAV